MLDGQALTGQCFSIIYSRDFFGMFDWVGRFGVFEAKFASCLRSESGSTLVLFWWNRGEVAKRKGRKRRKRIIKFCLCLMLFRENRKRI